MSRLDTERQQKLEPKRIDFAKNKIKELGFEITYECDSRLDFMFKGHLIKFYPYSGWHTGKTIMDGRGINNLVTQLIR